MSSLVHLLLTLLAVVGIAHGKLEHIKDSVSPSFSTPNGLIGVGGKGFALKDNGCAIDYNKELQMGNDAKWGQTCDGIKIYSSIVTTSSNKQGLIHKISGHVARNIVSVNKKFSMKGEDAVTVLKNRYKLNNDGLECESSFDKYFFSMDNNWLQPIYKVKVSCMPKGKSKLKPEAVAGRVDAETGAIMHSWQNIQHQRIPKKVKGILGNERVGPHYGYMDASAPINIDSVHDTGPTDTGPTEPEGRCYYEHYRKRIAVLDMLNGYSYSTVRTNFRCSRADEVDFEQIDSTGGFSARNEAYLYANHFYDLWTDEDFVKDAPLPHETDSAWLLFYVHYGTNYENAFFDGSRFTFGDGDTFFYPLTSLDIVCHEAGHAITSWHGGDMEYSGQSGGMNEAYSDMIGEACDIRFRNKTNFLIGDDTMRTTTQVALRDMCNPTNIPPSIDHLSDFYDSMNVHYSSGIYNKAFCLLSYSDGWDYRKAFQIFTRANLLYWTPTIEMHCGACAVEQAANDLNYRGLRAIRQAFRQVGVYCRFCS